MTTALIIILSVVLVALIIVLLVVFLRKNKEAGPKTTYVTKHNVIVKLSPLTKHITLSTFEGWLNDLLTFWNEKKQWKQTDMLTSLNNLTITAYDSCYLTIPWDNESGELKVSGVTYPSERLIKIAILPENNSTTIEERLRLLVRHEVSHMVAGVVGGYWDSTNSHQLFTDVKLGA
jgi:hypothetical protein